MYRYAAYNPKDSTIFLRTWSEEGARIDVEVPVTPYLYVETQDKNREATSIFKTPLTKKIFRNAFERSKFVKDCLTTRIFGNYPVEQQFLIDTFRSVVDDDEFSKFPLKIFFIDIEVDTHKYSINHEVKIRKGSLVETVSLDMYRDTEDKEVYEIFDEEKDTWGKYKGSCYTLQGGFPTPSEARVPINLITVYDTLTQKYHTWGLKEAYKSKEEDVIYHRCDTEKELLFQFLNFWQEDYCDILCGWNTEGFDIPYIINRIEKILGEEGVLMLSPVKRVYSRDGFDDFGKTKTNWFIDGISLIDYMVVYKKFSRSPADSYALNNIANIELGEGKTAFNATSLAALSEENWELFVDYNIQDVGLLVRLDNKLNFLKIVRLLSYKGCTNFEKSLGKVAIIAGAVAMEALKGDLILSTFKKDDNEQPPLKGGFVTESTGGIQKGIVSFDVNSLYPNTIVTLNISPETKIGNINSVRALDNNEEVNVTLVNGNNFPLSPTKFKMFIEKEQLAVSRSGTLYTQKQRGIIPSLINRVYGERVEIKKKNAVKKRELASKKKEIKDKFSKELQSEINVLVDQISTLSALDWAIKILLNSIYGAQTNKYSSILDMDNAASITHTGQAVVKEGAEIIRKYAKNKYAVDVELLLAGDTDSEYITIQPVLDKLGLSLTIDGKINPDVSKLVEELGNYINTDILKWAKKKLNSDDPRFEFKREAIADVGIFLEKKRYILHILDEEGIPCDKFKYVGVEMARSSISKSVKAIMKPVLETALLTQDVYVANRLYKEAFEKFKELSVVDISKRTGIKDCEKYAHGTSLNKFNKGTPGHVRATLTYNYLLEELKLTQKYEAITNGNKVKHFYTLKNPFGIDHVAYNGDNFPEEFKEHGIEPDKEKMFMLLVSAGIERLYNGAGWRFPELGKEKVTDLLDLFS